MTEYDLVEIFKSYFDIRFAATKEDLKTIFGLRYQVFCKEFQFESEQDCPNQQETDSFDANAIHTFLYHHKTNDIAGCIRLLLPKFCTLPLPFEQFTNDEFTPMQGSQYAEVSRLTVKHDFRRRVWDGNIPTGVSNKVSQMGKVSRNFPLPAISMIFCGAALSRLYLLDYAYAMMEPRLVYAMSSYGLYFEQIGPLSDYHGERAAYRISPIQIWQTIIPELKPLLNFVYFKLSQSIPEPINVDSRKVG
jgi:N-acyl amino acid synthase of PEP-CTERM/exosortase system